MPRGTKGNKDSGAAKAAPAARESSSEVAWPAPAALEGVKSRKRPIFKVEKAVGLGKCGTRSASSISINLDSRVLALGDGGEAVLPLLLDPKSVVPTRHASLGVARLGPHLAGAAASADEHKVAVSEALASRPQIVVLEERLPDGGVAWVDVFHGLLRSAALRSFRGAVIVVAREETFLLREVCTERWADGQQVMETHQEAITGCNLQISQDALANTSPSALLEVASPSSRKRGGRGGDGSEGPGEMLWEAVSLFELMFEEDLLEKVKTEGWKVSFLIQTSADGYTKHLLGLICYSLASSLRAELHVDRIAVQMSLRGRGFGRILMQWIIEEAARMPTSRCACISCSALDNVVPFYQRVGFAACARPESWPVPEGEPQTWMELPNASLVGEVAEKDTSCTQSLN
jgi:GNAT superfamily N-acetyltransferase